MRVEDSVAGLGIVFEDPCIQIYGLLRRMKSFPAAAAAGGEELAHCGVKIERCPRILHRSHAEPLKRNI